MSDTSNQSSDEYYGQLGLADLSSPINMQMYLIRQALAQISSVKLVEVVKVYNEEGKLDKIGKIDVRPITHQVDGIGKPTPHGIIYGVTYHRHQGGKNATIMDPVKGDIGMALVADRDISSNKANYEKDKPIPANPGSSRRFDLSDMVYLGGALNAKPDQYARFTKDGVTHSALKTYTAQATKGNIINTATQDPDNKSTTGNLTHTADGGNIKHTAKKKNGEGGDTTHTSEGNHTTTAANEHTINAQTSNVAATTHNIDATTNISKITSIAQLLKVSSVAQLTNFVTGVSGGSTQAKTTNNLIDPPAPLTSYTVVMPTVDNDGNPLTDGIGCSITFGDGVTSLTLTGPFYNTPPASASPGQVMKFTWSENSNSWWNA